MALDIARESRADVVQGAESGPSLLAGIRGHGTLQVLRDPRGEVLSLRGTWRPDEEATDLAELDRAVRDAAAVRFDGRLADPGRPERTEVVVRCAITSYGDYRFDAGRAEGEAAPTLRVYNFRPVDDAEVLDPA